MSESSVNYISFTIFLSSIILYMTSSLLYKCYYLELFDFFNRACTNNIFAFNVTYILNSQ